MRLIRIGFMTVLGAVLVIPAVGHATDGTEPPPRVAEPVSPPSPQPPPDRTHLTDAPEQVGRSFRQVGDSVETGAKSIGHAVEDSANQFGRAVNEGWRSFRRGLSGD